METIVEGPDSVDITGLYYPKPEKPVDGWQVSWHKSNGDHGTRWFLNNEYLSALAFAKRAKETGDVD